MKKKLAFIAIVLAICSFKLIDEPNPLLGKWESKTVYKEGPLSILLLFRADGTYDGFANKKTFVNGTYHVSKDTIFIADPICNSKYNGKYKLTIFGERDSVKFDVISDTCKARVAGANGFTFKRVK
ncbi:hypothetical protein OQZ33_11765 [Pedobacter sp. MC2016-05]|uniref:hypothetical protein n=1 Tax=Pedobacter sp. MC2016-05 TaxID=2994474 RepID=UPI002246F5E5|nr:hypothetical protein [Pedobacter sp. MC2016-05]MCX2475009.1 hypothetical protein [Pedobacter sp. MC2016-05]